jgi:hypothetical protein
MKPLGSHTATKQTNRRQEHEFLMALNRGSFAGLGKRQGGKKCKGVEGREGRGVSCKHAVGDEGAGAAQ